MDDELPFWNTANGIERISTSQNERAHFYNPFLIAIKSKFQQNHKAVFVAFIIVIFVLLITIIAVACKGYTSSTENICKTKECIRAAANLLQSMDEAVDPCGDFYQFTCGNWADEHPRPDSEVSYGWFSDKQTKLLRTISTFLQANVSSTDPETIVKIKTMYQACMNLEEIDELGFTPLMAYLKEYKLPQLPSFLNKSQSENGTIEYDWIESLASIKKLMGMDVLFGFDIISDPINRTINRVGIGSPTKGSSLPFNDDDYQKRVKRAKMRFLAFDSNESMDEMDEDYPAEGLNLKGYSWYIQEIISKVILFVEPDTNLEDISENLNASALEIVRITKSLQRISEEADYSDEPNDNPVENYINLSTEELQYSTDELITPNSLPIWKKYLSIMFDSIENLKFDTNSDKILTSKASIKFLKGITKFMSETPLLNIELFIWWSIVEELIIYTTTEMRNLNNEYLELIEPSRSLHCTASINSLMDMAVTYAIADEKFLENSRPKVETMLSNIHEAFSNLVKEISWMDAYTKSQTLDKSANIKSFIGFPDWIHNKTMLDEYYSEIEINNNTHLDNMIAILKWKMHKKLISLNILDKPDDSVWGNGPANVNAFYTFELNTISVPIAVLQYPFYDLGLEALNYGAIGTILGHELTHAFDNSGRMYDKYGNMKQWWTNRTITEYISRTSCFIEQYENFYYPEINEYVDGDLTLGENIADNGGLREAYYAYKIFVKNNGIEKSLPGLEKYTSEQLFFISLGNLWCETKTPDGTSRSLENTHCPGRMRMRGVLFNSAEFSSTFGCQKGSGMYPTEDRCRIW